MRRTRHRWAVLVVVVGLLAALTGTAGASPLSAPMDLSTQAGIAQYLWSIGIDPATATIQTGLRNYAGPNCPGAGWNCAAAIGPIVQITSAQGINQFECSDQTCSTVQPGPGDNFASCIQKTSANPATQTCTITQGGAGNNHATVEQIAVQKAGDTQGATQTAEITQTTGSGKNEARVVQLVEQYAESKDGGSQNQDADQDASVTQTSSTGENNSSVTQTQTAEAKAEAKELQTPSQTQEGDQGARVDQLSTTGKNTSSLTQTQDQKANAKAEQGAVTQKQNESSGDGPNQEIDVSQNSNVLDLDPRGGDQTSSVQQKIVQEAKTDGKEGAVNQFQGSADGGLSIGQFQNSSGVSTHADDQDKVQVWDAKTDGTVTRLRFDPTRCCAGTTQVGNEANTCDIDQTVVQQGGDADNSFADVEALETTSGNCTADQSVTQDGETTTNSDSGMVINIFIECGVEGCFSGEVVDEGDFLLALQAAPA
jgi:hypothetical protein